LVFDQDGQSLFSATQDGGLERWDLDSQSWIERLCELAGRDFNPEELESYDTNPICAEHFPQPTGTPGP